MVDKVRDVSLVGCVYGIDVLHVVQVKQVCGALAVVHMTPPLCFVRRDDLERNMDTSLDQVCLSETQTWTTGQTDSADSENGRLSSTDLSHILHDERVLFDALQRANAPPPAILRLEDAQVELYALLHHSVRTVRAAAALGVTLVYGLPWPYPDLALVIVRHAVQGGPGAAAIHGLL